MTQQDSSGLELQVPITRVVGSSLRKFPACWFLPPFAVVNPLPVLHLSIFGFRGTCNVSKGYLLFDAPKVPGNHALVWRKFLSLKILLAEILQLLSCLAFGSQIVYSCFMIHNCILNSITSTRSVSPLVY